MSYRKDIDGLRAISVAGVVLYHAAPSLVSRGYLGVDIFFVISGFLITGILRSELGAGRFTVWQFYERRIRRIIPALTVVCAATVSGALLVMFPADILVLSTDLMSAAAFVANIHFFQSITYFSQPAELRPLLHLWSLSVEEQFYVLFPFITWIGFRTKRLTPLLIGIGAVSLTAYVLVHRAHPSAAFYLLPFRAWELMLGAVAAVTWWTPNRRIAQAASWAGLLSIVYAMIYGADPWFPCLGVALILRLNADGDMIPPLIWRPMVWLGLISYSLYLWHWPLFSLTRYYLVGSPGPILSIALIGASTGLAALTWAFVEQPFRRGMDRRRVFAFGGAALAGMLLLGIAMRITNGAPWRFPAEAREMASYEETHGAAFHTAIRDGQCLLTPEQGPAAFDEATCLNNRGKPKTILLWGDSFAAHYYPGLESAFQDDPVSILQATASSCPPVLAHANPDRPFCVAINDYFFSLIAKLKPDIVALSASWNGFDTLDELDRTIDRLQRTGTKIVLIGTIPVYKMPLPMILAHRLSGRKVDPSSLLLDNVGSTERIMKIRYGKAHVVELISILDVLCDQGPCRTTVDDGVPVSIDTGHLTPQSSRFVADRIKPQLVRILDGSAPPERYRE
jgi:peptidoglycan/LPS O-acetylase OafA/YrhL